MSDSVIRSRYATRVSDDGHLADVHVEAEPWDDLGCFSHLRGIRDRATMLALRRRTGNVVAIGYAWLEQADFDPSEGITLHLLGRTIRIRGRNLNAEVRTGMRLFEGITRHRVAWIQEADDAEILAAGADATVVERIVF